jgi:hypothetical protein
MIKKDLNFEKEFESSFELDELVDIQNVGRII